MDASLLVRLVPAVAVAVAVAWWVGRPAQVPAGAVVDEALRGLLVGVIAGRVGWLVLGGPSVWRAVPSTFYLLRAGVETWIGAAVAVAWVAWRSTPERRSWLLAAAPAASLAGLAAWHAGCGIEGVCAGRPVAWGVHLPGYLSSVVPAGYLTAAVALAAAVVALRARTRPAVAVGAVAAYALGRAAVDLGRAPLGGLPTRDQILSLVAAATLAGIAWRLRGRRLQPRPEELS